MRFLRPGQSRPDYVGAVASDRLVGPMLHGCASFGVSGTTSPSTPAPSASPSPPDPPPATRPTTSLPQRRAPHDIVAATTSIPPPRLSPPAGSLHKSRTHGPSVLPAGQHRERSKAYRDEP